MTDSRAQRRQVKGTNSMCLLLLLASSSSLSSSSLVCSLFSLAMSCLRSQALCFSGSKFASNLMNFYFHRIYISSLALHLFTSEGCRHFSEYRLLASQVPVSKKSHNNYIPQYSFSLKFLPSSPERLMIFVR